MAKAGAELKALGAPESFEDASEYQIARVGFTGWRGMPADYADAKVVNEAMLCYCSSGAYGGAGDHFIYKFTLTDNQKADIESSASEAEFTAAIEGAF